MIPHAIKITQTLLISFSLFNFATASILSVDPDSAEQEEVLFVSITGQATTFYIQQGSETVSNINRVYLQQDITTIEGDNISYLSQTNCRARFTIAADAFLGLWNVAVEQITGGTHTLPNGFTIMPRDTTPQITSVVPDHGEKGEYLVVTITGKNTIFRIGNNNNVSTVFLQKDTTIIDADGFLVASATLVDASFSIPLNAQVGSYNLAVVEDSLDDTVTLVDGFTVLDTGMQLVSHWSFNEGTGDTLSDLTNYNNNGTIYGATWEIDSVGGAALRFDGIDDYVFIPHSPTLDITKKITITAWVCPEPGIPFCSHLVGKMVKETSGDWQGSYWMTLSGETNRNWGFSLSTNPGAIDHWASENVTYYEWNLLTATFDDSLNEVKLYLNENPVDTFFEDNALTANNLPVYIGRNNNYSAMRYFKGLIGDIRLYHSVLSEKEIIDIYYELVKKPTILSAVASDATILQPGIDEDDYVLITFGEKVDVEEYPINQVNIDTLLPLTNGHTWRSGFGTVDDIQWNPDSTMLLINLSTSVSVPTIAVGDSVCLTKYGTKVEITGSFGGTGIISANSNKYNREFKIIQNAGSHYIKFICPSLSSENSSVTIYSLNGSVIRELKIQNISVNKQITWDGTDNCSNLVGSGVYIVRFTDRNIIQQKKLFFID